MWSYGAAAAAVFVAAWLHLALDPVLGEAHPFAFFYAAVLLVAWRFGSRPGWLALVLSAFFANYLLFAPAWPSADADALLGLAVFLGIGAGLVLLANRGRQSADNVRARAAALDDERARRETAEAEAGRLKAVLSERTEELQTLIASSPAAVGVATDPACEQVCANPAFVDMFGVQGGGNGVNGASLPFKVYRQGRKQAASDLPAQISARDGVRLRDVEFEITRNDGRRITVRGNVAPLYRPTGEVRGCVAAFVDVGERRAAELEHNETNHREDELLAVLAHELRNPLAPLRNAASILGRQGQGNETVRWARDVIERQVSQLSRLVDNLVEVSQLTRGLITLKKEPADLRTLVRQAVEQVWPLLESRKQRLRVDLPMHPLPARVEGARIVEAIVNVLTNAAKYTPPEGSIHITGRRDDDVLKLTIRDNGPGIAPELLPRVFDLFARGDRSLGWAESGPGIGLALVKKIMELHEGAADAHSAGPGKGAEFVLSLPLAEPAERSDPAALAPPGTSKILVVDDNPDIADTLSVLLGMNGYDVRTAYTGETALEIARDFRPAVALLDIGLPRMDGYELARRFRSDPALGRMHLVAVTGYSQEADRVRGREAGFEHYITKPCDPEHLAALIEESLVSSPAQPRFPERDASGRPAFPRAPS